MCGNNQANQLSGPFAHQFLLTSYLPRFLPNVCNNVYQLRSQKRSKFLVGLQVFNNNNNVLIFYSAHVVVYIGFLNSQILELFLVSFC